MTDVASALARLQSLRAVVADEFVAAIDCVVAHVQSDGARVDCSQVVALLSERAARTDYIVLRAVLREIAQAVAKMSHPAENINVARAAPTTERNS